MVVAAQELNHENLVPSWEMSLRAEGLEGQTLKVYPWHLRQLVAFQQERGMPLNVDAVTREHIEMFQVARRERGLAAATLVQGHWALRKFFAWCFEG